MIYVQVIATSGSGEMGGGSYLRVYVRHSKQHKSQGKTTLGTSGSISLVCLGMLGACQGMLCDDVFKSNQINLYLYGAFHTEKSTSKCLTEINNSRKIETAK